MPSYWCRFRGSFPHRVAMSAMIAVLIVAASGPVAGQHQRTVVRIGTEGAYPPFTSVDINNRLSGFDIDLAKALCEEMAVSCEFVQEKFQNLIPALLANRFDAIMSAMAITKERSQHVNFSIQYRRSSAAFAALTTSTIRDSSPAALRGKTLGAQIGTTHARVLKKIYQPAGAIIQLYPTQNEAILNLASGRVDAVLASKLALLEWMSKTREGACCSFVGGDASYPEILGEGTGVAVRKSDTELLARFNHAIEAIRANGTFRTINDRYFPFDTY